MDFGFPAERGFDRFADGAQQVRAQLIHLGVEVPLGAPGFRGERGLADDECAGGQVLWDLAGIGDGEENGAAQGDGGPVVQGWPLGLEGGAGGEAAQGGGHGGAEGMEVVEGLHPGLISELVQLQFGGGERVEGSDVGVDEAAEHAGSLGFAAAWGALEDEDGEGAGGAEGGEQPGEAAEPILLGVEVAEAAEVVESGGEGFGGGLGEVEPAADAKEGEVGLGVDAVALGGDFDGDGIAGVEGDGEGIGAEGDADGGVGEGHGAGFGRGVEFGEDAADGVGSEGVVVFFGVAADEEVADGGVVEGPGVVAAAGGAAPGLAVGGVVDKPVPGIAEDRADLVARFGDVAHGRSF